MSINISINTKDMILVTIMNLKQNNKIIIYSDGHTFDASVAGYTITVTEPNVKITRNSDSLIIFDGIIYEAHIEY